MGHKNPKAKGGEWERAVCKRLSMWVSDLTREDIFWRSSMSGGRATFQTRKNRDSESKYANQAGDISAISPEGMPLIQMFYLECKHLADLHLDGIPYGATSEVKKYWGDTCVHAKTYNKIPLVVAKENYRDPLLMTTADGASFLAGARKDDAQFQVRAIFPLEDMHVFMFRDLLTDIDYKNLCQRIKVRLRSTEKTV